MGVTRTSPSTTWAAPFARATTPTRQSEDGKLVVKLFLRHPLHAKLYLLYRTDPNNPKTGFLGSSNLTFARLCNQGELNVDVLAKRPDSGAALENAITFHAVAGQDVCRVKVDIITVYEPDPSEWEQDFRTRRPRT